MSKPTNCFQIVGSKLVVGIPFYAKAGSYFIDPGSSLRDVIRLQLQYTERCMSEGLRILKAAPPHNPRSDYALDCRLPFDGVIVFFDTTELDFEGPYATGLTMWPGGEWLSRSPLRRKTHNPEVEDRFLRQEGAKVEIWTLRNSEKVFIVDCREGVRLMSVENGIPKLETPDFFTAASYLHELARTISPQGLNWLQSNLRAPHAASHDRRIEDIQREVAALS